MEESPLSERMERLNADNLKKLAKLLGAGTGLTRKAEIIAALSRFIVDELPRVLTHCSEAEKLALAEAAHGGGSLDPRSFWGKHGARCPNPKQSYSYGETPSPFGVLMARDDFGMLWVAPETAETIRTLLPKPEETAIKTMEGELPQRHGERPVCVHCGERSVFSELRRVLGLAQGGKLAVTAKRGAPSDACARRIGEALILPDLDLEMPEDERKCRAWAPDTAGPTRAFAWGVVTQQCGWCKAAGSKLDLTRKGRTMLADGGADAFKEGFGRLLDDDDFDELIRIPNIRGQTGKGKRSLTKPSSRRHCIVEAMAEWPEGEWIAFDDAFRFVWASGNTFEVSGNPWDLYFCEKGYGSLGYASGDDGNGLERQYLRVFLVETLATLGIVDIAYVYPHGLWPEFGNCWGIDELDFCGGHDGLLHVRLTRLGAFCLGKTDAYEMPETDTAGLVKILPNLELVRVNDAACSLADAARLELFASPKNERVWRIDRNRMLTHLETGGSMDDIRREIESVADGEIPATVTAFIDEIEKKVTALKVGQPCLLIEAVDQATAALIAHDPGASKVCLPAGARHLAVPKKNERAFRAAVKKLGYVLPQ